MSEPKKLSAGTKAVTVRPAEELLAEVVEVIPIDRGSISIYARTDHFTYHHESISPELMTLGIQKARAEADAAAAKYAVPAKEQTRQVIAIAIAIVAVVGIGVYGAIRSPASAQPIAAMVAVIGVVFGGLYGGVYYLTKKAGNAGELPKNEPRE